MNKLLIAVLICGCMGVASGWAASVLFGGILSVMICGCMGVASGWYSSDEIKNLISKIPAY